MSRGFEKRPEDRCNPRSPSPTKKKRKLLYRRQLAEGGRGRRGRALSPHQAEMCTALLNMSLNKKMSSQFVEQGYKAALLDLAHVQGQRRLLRTALRLSIAMPYGDYYPPWALLAI